MDRPELSSVDAPAGLTRDELRIFPNRRGYHLFLGFGSDMVEFQVTAEGSFERRERSDPSMAYRRYELSELPATARQAVEAIVADYRAARVSDPGPTL